MLTKNAQWLFTLIAKAADEAGVELGQARVRAAAHESGHALVAWSSMHVAGVTGARLRGIGNGAVNYDIRSDAFDRSVAWDATAISLAGLAGEAVVFRSVRSRDSEDDLLKALAAARRIVEGGWARPWTAVPGAGLDIGAMFASPPEADIAATLRQCYLRARGVILQRPDLFKRLQRELLARGALDADDIDRLLGPRPWATFR